MLHALPLSALLSQLWIAFTIEVDNLFELRMPHTTTRDKSRTGGPWLVSHAMWWNCMRHVDETGISVDELEMLARTRTNLGGMVRWGYVTLAPKPKNRVSHPPRGTLVRATYRGIAARAVWATLPGEVEHRWRTRLGDQRLGALEQALRAMTAQLAPNLPDCLPILGYGLLAAEPIGHRSSQDKPSLQAMLARTLLAFTLDYETNANSSLAVDANVLRLIDADAVRLRDLPAASGISKEAVSVAASLLERRALAHSVSQDGARWLTLTASGRAAQKMFCELVPAIESQWRGRFGEGIISALRDALEDMVLGERGQCFLAEATAPPPTGWRNTMPATRVLPWQPMVLHRGGYPDGY